METFLKKSLGRQRDGLGNLVRLLASLTLQPPWGIGVRRLWPGAPAATPPRPQALLRRRQGKPAPRTQSPGRVPGDGVLGRGCQKDGGEMLPGRRMAWEVPPLQLTSLLTSSFCCLAV